MALLIFAGLNVIFLGLWRLKSIRAENQQIASSVNNPSAIDDAVGASRRRKVDGVYFVFLGSLQKKVRGDFDWGMLNEFIGEQPSQSRIGMRCNRQRAVPKADQRICTRDGGALAAQLC